MSTSSIRRDISRRSARPGHGAERRFTVVADDGVRLAAREYGPADAELTVVFLHGHCLRSESWTYVRDLIQRDTRVRVVAYDHRGHGDSEQAAAATYTIEQLGHDLRAVLDAIGGPVVLVGHSMGGMTAMTFARQYPHEIGARVHGLALIATAASGVADAGCGRLLRNPAVSWFQGAVRRAPGLMHVVKRAACAVLAPVIRWAEYGDRTVSPRVIALAAAMRNQTSIVTMATFLSSLMCYDESHSLPALSDVHTLILAGSADLMTPPTHAVAMAALIRGSEFVTVDGAGHSVIMEQPARVAEELVQLLARISGSDRDRPFALAA